MNFQKNTVGLVAFIEAHASLCTLYLPSYTLCNVNGSKYVHCNGRKNIVPKTILESLI